MSSSPALQSFLAKWRERWPEWPLAETFVPEAQREPAVAWFALLQELEDVMNVAGDPLPADAKLGWWAEELRDWSRHRSRHPLGRVLEPHAAPWAGLADALPLLQAMREPWADAEVRLAQLRPLAEAIAAVEQALFGASHPGAAADIGVQWLVMRWLGSGQGQGAELDALMARWPQRARGSLPRRLWAGLARRRVAGLQAHGPQARPVSRWALLWTAWRAARG